MHFIPEALDNYVVSHTQQEPELLQQLTRETYQKILQPRMLSGPYQGRVLSMISKLIHPKTILEIGTYTGYSALCLAEGMQKEGQIHTIDINEELEPFTQKYFDQSEFKDQIDFRIGNAINIVPEIQEEIDLVFIDADKENYPNYYNLVFDKVRKGGFIVADNVLWSGKVLEDIKPNDKDTPALIEFNKMVQNDERVENVLAPIRDGLMIVRKK